MEKHIVRSSRCATFDIRNDNVIGTPCIISEQSDAERRDNKYFRRGTARKSDRSSEEKLAYELSRAAVRTVCTITIFKRLSKPRIPVKGLTTMNIVATKNGATTAKGCVTLVRFPVSSSLYAFFPPFSRDRTRYLPTRTRRKKANRRALLFYRN